MGLLGMNRRFALVLAMWAYGLCASAAHAADYYVTGKISSLLAHGTDPGIRIEGPVTPTGCNGGQWGWMYFQGATAEERHRVYSTAVALFMAGRSATVYTNTDGSQCRITNIQAFR